MLLVLLLVCIGLIIGGLYVYESFEWTGCFITVFGGFGTLITIVVMIFVICFSSGIRTIPSKIEILEQQNTKIEQQLDAVVNEYLSHESDTYNKMTPYDLQVFAVAYPQLASNETVKKQMEVYVSNNEKITEYKLELCNAPMYRWWLYFGK